MIDPKLILGCKTIFDPLTQQYICMTEVNGEAVIIGGYEIDPAMPEEMREEYQRFCERQIWEEFINEQGKYKRR